MRVLLLCRAFNGLSQRILVELEDRGHEVSVELDVNDSVTIEGVALFRPDLVLATYLTRRIPEAVWRKTRTLVVHPGPPGDRGPAALDHAIMDGVASWGVTLLEAQDEMDGGDIWASRLFAMRDATKSSLYRNEVTEAACACVLEAVLALEHCEKPATRSPQGIFRPALRQADRQIAWQTDTTAEVLAKLRAADGQPGVRDDRLGLDCYLFDGHPALDLRGEPGTLLAQRHGAVCVATADGAVWIGHARPVPATDLQPTFKRPAALVLPSDAKTLPEADGPDRIGYSEERGVGYLAFDFYNGAMSTADCGRLLWAYRQALRRPTKVLVLEGGREFWSNGMNLTTIEAAASPAEESWANINAMDDLAEAIAVTTDKVVIAQMRGNAGAGGVFLALAADRVLARDGIVLNPHYKNMGNLFGSELWTYLLPRRVEADAADAMMATRRPIGTTAALKIGLIDTCLPGERSAADAAVVAEAEALAADPAFDALIADKQKRRVADEAQKPLTAYRAEELERMRLNFFGFDSSYHVARYHFVHKLRPARTPFHLARHRG